MAESIKIEIFRRKDAEDFTKALADPESRAHTGSGAAMTAAVSAALLERAAKLTREELPELCFEDHRAAVADYYRGLRLPLLRENAPEGKGEEP